MDSMVAQLLQEGVHQLAGCWARNFSTMTPHVCLCLEGAGKSPGTHRKGAQRPNGMPSSRGWDATWRPEQAQLVRFPPLRPQASTDRWPNAETPWQTSGSALCRDR